MNINLEKFNTENLFEATKDLFEKQLKIPLNSNTEQTINPKDILKDKFKDRNPFTNIEEDGLYFAGLIDDSVFNSTDKLTLEKAQKTADEKYDGLLIFAIKLKETPKRSEIAELTRGFNQISKKMPVGLVFKYDNEISIALSERFKYLKDWREGEKVGKVIILRDMDIKDTHAGHLRILEDLANHNAKNFNDLHKKWLDVLDLNILNKNFFTEISHWYFWAMDIVEFPDDAEKNKEIRNSTNLIRLITRIIFIWFIKEKGLVPENLFDEKQLKNTVKNFGKNNETNYYNAILQNLFFGTLNQIMNDRGFISDRNFQGKNNKYNITTRYRYPDLFSISEKEAVNLFKDVPFLNGGLFDCLDKPDENGNNVVRIDGFSTTTKNRAVVPDILFFGTEQEIDLNNIYDTKNTTYKCKGLINILNSYKFTITENTSSEEDVALDPELLGKVFENLLASYNDETKTTARKQTGSFYTPREIVDYMVNESLGTYLRENVGENWENDKKTVFALNDIKILDPACGSGAFPMGILHKMVEILQKLDPDNAAWRELQEGKAMAEMKDAIKIENQQERDDRLKEISDIFENNVSDYGRKLFLIENCIFGVDIQPIAIQISKLRFFLSLVIEQEIDKSKDNLGIRPLPNLETKFVAANTLIDLEKEDTIFRTPEINAKENELKQVRHEYFTANNRKKKLDLQKKDKKLRGELAKLLKNIGYAEKSADSIANFDPYNQNAHAEWFDAEWMFGLTQENERLNATSGAFDIVIGNPPYVNIEKIDKNIKDNIHKFKTAYQKYDLYVLFYEKAIDLLKNSGILSFITSNKFLSQGYGLLLRKEFLKNYINSIINFNYDVFDAATVRTCIFIMQKQNQANENIKIIDINSEKDKDKFVKLEYNLLNQNIFNETDENNFRINLTNEKLKVLYKIKANAIRIDDIFSVNYGLRPSSEKLGLKKEAFINNENPNNFFKKYFEGKDMGYWKVKQSSFIDYRPDVMYNAMFKELFENEKLVGLRTLSDIGKLRFIYDNEGFYCNDSVVILVLWHLFKDINNQTIKRNITKYKIETSMRFSYAFVQGILNSKMIKFYVNELLYDGTHFYPNHIKSLPIKNISLSQQQPIIDLVNQILSVKKENLSANISELEKRVDRLVYEIYGLTEEEINIIENF